MEKYIAVSLGSQKKIRQFEDVPFIFESVFDLYVQACNCFGFKSINVFERVNNKAWSFPGAINFPLEGIDTFRLNFGFKKFSCFREECKIHLALKIGKLTKCHSGSLFCHDGPDVVYHTNGN